MPTRHQKSFAFVVAFALCLSSLLSSVTPLWAQSQQRMRRPNTPPKVIYDSGADQNDAPAFGGIVERTNYASSSNTLAEGTVIITQMMTKLSSKTAQAGDRLRAKVIVPVTDRNNNVLIPAGSLIEGQVQDVARARSRRRSGMIEISFDRLRIGEDAYALQATVAPA
ncbi:MAG: hypothetical protein HOP19_19835, partial [Acidobacteria bacterium]|nr:hypothetical protein [Acidobacteriota bacterium]